MQAQRVEGPIFPTSTRHFNSNFSATNTVAVAQLGHQHQYPPNPSFLDSRNEPGLDIATQLSNCSQILQLNQVYAHIITTDHLGFNPAPFHWNNITRWPFSSRACEGCNRHVHEIRKCGFVPDGVTMVNQAKATEKTNLLMWNSLIDIGAVQEGRYYFDMMKTVYGITPKLQRYGCMVDLLGRAGLLEDARKMVEEMPMKPNSIVWGCLMGACEKYRHVEMAEWVAKHLQALEPWSDGAYVV
ncbi:hypothetical protein L6164_006747 [Bauhinia variegata]|uniref:Uncharacterized protein n=1 Tax=Bauhinia variegata TaxID=167791 RepID=A0ACB9PY62_BAUVA|nr:hypothetical protein L6164_006747 [Bauhinia variegata]